LIIRLVSFLLFSIWGMGVASAQTLNPKPVKALGAPHLLATQANPGALDSTNPNYIEGRELFNPTAIALDPSTNPPAVYIADTTNNRVLGWKYTSQLANGAPADVVLGQKDFFSTLPQGPGGLVTGLNAPTGVAVDKSGNVYVADTGNNRILRFPQPFTQRDSPKPVDLILGQSGFNTSNPNPQGVLATSLFLSNQQGFPPHIGLALGPSGDLFVTDPGNNRVLRYPVAALNAGQNGAAADLQLGQATFTSNSLGPANRGDKTALAAPTALAFDSAGRLYVGDAAARVLVYTPGFTTRSAAARILGVVVAVPNQPAPPAVSAINIGFASGITIGPGNRPVIVDSVNSRVLIYDSFENFPAETPTSLSPAASVVIGQSSFALRAANQGVRVPNSSSLSSPFDAAASATELYIVDTGNNRVLSYSFPASGPNTTAIRVLGQVGFNLNAPNLLEGREFFLSAGNVNGSSGSIVIDRNSNPPHLYVADTNNNRILGFNDFNAAKAGDFADLVIGQQNLLTGYVNGPQNDPATPNQSGLNQPTALVLDPAGNLYIADTGNSRVLRFPQPFAQGSRTGQNADLVIGQANFSSVVTSATNRNMQAPSGVAVASDGSLLVSDSALNRVLFFSRPLSSGMGANKVLGQTDFNSPNTNTPVAPTVFDPSRFASPRQIAVDPQDRVYVCDTGNRRIAIFDTIGNLSTTLPATAISLSANLNQPIGITIGTAGSPNAGQLWVSDFGRNQVFHYPPFNQLLQNGSPDLGVGALHPLSAAFDSFGDLAVADGANRVLLFVPQLTVTNASSFATGSFAPGTIVSIFPAASPSTSSTAILSASPAANFNDLPNPLPLPTTLGDVQALVNGQPAPLFYVAPGQINLPLPSNLPTSGTVDLQVVSKSTARIFGSTEISLSAVSPGLFTLRADGNGQLAAINNPSGTVNTASSPLVRGQYITFFGTGQGPVPNAPPDGTLATGITPTADTPRVVIGGVELQSTDVQYSGLAPGLIGVWQINVRVPQEVTAGNQVPVVVYLRSVPTQSTTFIALR